MNQLHVRCPSCTKLYQVSVSTIFSTTPKFECVVCHSHFEFDFPAATDGVVQARYVATSAQIMPEVVVAPTASVILANMDEQKKCPKCGAMTSASAYDCQSCQIVFEKFAPPPGQSVLSKTSPYLTRAWRDVIENYENEDSHQAFLMTCRQHDSLDFAVRMYKEIQRAQGQDEIAAKMLARIEVMAMTSNTAMSAENIETKATSTAQWLRYVIMIPFAISAVLVVWGLTHTGPRNTVGTGIAIAVLFYGLVTSFFGPIKKLLKP